ncbi:MAG TPA: hypothetical protein VGC34_14990 [Steroidobacteraceae bacterium]
MTLYEARLRRAAADLPADRAPQAVGELVDVVVELLEDLPPFRSKETVEGLLASTFRRDHQVDRAPRARLLLIVDNTEEVNS